MVASSAIYGGCYNLLVHTMRRMGLECTFVAPNATDEELEAAFRPNTKCVFGETIANPALAVLDIERFAAAAHAQGVPLIVDNTFPTPVNCRPIEWGADIVTHSTTKYMDGHGAAVGGAILDVPTPSASSARPSPIRRSPCSTSSDSPPPRMPMACR